MDKKFHFLYRITNTVNQHYYIGIHSTDDIDDGYMGSGSLLKEAIKEFGISNFRREIIESFETREIALSTEASIVNIKLLEDPKCYNLVIGGNLGIVTTSSKRALFRKPKPIYSTDANEVIITEAKRWDPDYKYTFVPVPEEVEKWKQSCHLMFSIFKDKSYAKFQYDLTLMGVEIWPSTLKSITDTFNNKITNGKAVKFLSLIKSKNLESCYTINRERW